MMRMHVLFKQKTAYEIRIGDWSSDVCSSDLYRRRSPGCMEYGTGVYTGALPYHSGGNVEPYGTISRVRSEQPVHFGLMFNVQRLKIGRASCRERVCQYG